MKETTNKNNKFLNAKEAGSRLGIPLSTLYRLARNGAIKTMHIGGRWYYPENEIERFLSCDISSRNYETRVNELPERRAYPRMNCRIGCSYSVELPEKKGIFVGLIKNISGNGLLLSGSARINDINVEDPIALEFRLTKDNNNEDIINIKGRVVRKTKDACGIAFRNINKENQNSIIQYVG